MRVGIFVALLLSLAAPAAFGATCTSTGDGNWGTPGLWSCGAIPTAADDVVIDNGDDVAVDVTGAVARSVTFNGTAANNMSLTINTGRSLTVSQNVTFTASTSTNRIRNIIVQANAQLVIGGNLAMNTGTVTGSQLGLTIANSATSLVQIGGSVTFSGTVAPSIVFSGVGNLTVAGNFPSGITFTRGTGTITFNGTGAQTMGAYTYANVIVGKTGGTVTTAAAVTTTTLIFAASNAGSLSTAGTLTATALTFGTNNTGSLTAAGDVTATSLTFAAGNTGVVSMSGTSTLSISTSCVTAVTRTGGGHVIGNLEYTFPTGAPTCTYHVGDATNYSPVTVAFTGSGGGTLTARATNAVHPQSATWPLSSTKYVQRYWTLGATGDTLTTFTTYDATLNWVAGDIQGGGNYQNFIVGQYRGGWVAAPAFASNTATSIVVDNVATTFPTTTDFVVGEVVECLPPANAPAGVTCVCDNFLRSSLNPSSIFGGNWLLSTSSGSFGIPQIVNPGYLRLTDNAGNNSAAATVPGIFPAAGNYISVEFKQYAYNGSGADGIAVTLSDYSVAPTPGAFGGSLGYAQKTGINGFAGGWIGVALDEYGNYENNTEGRIGTAGGTGLFPDSIGVRGSGSLQTGYPWLTGALNLGGIDAAASTTPANGYRYQVIVDATAYTTATKTALITVRRDTTGTGNSYTTVVPQFDAYVANPAQAAVPVNWQISFTGSTGGATNIHEIGNLRVCANSVFSPTASTTAAGFNAIDSALPNTKQNALFGHIYMKVANVPFTLNVAALLPLSGGVSQGVNTVYASSGGNKTVTVKLFDDSQAGTSCNSSASACLACAKTQVGTTQTITFTGADGGFKVSPAFTVNGAYKRLIAQMNDGTTTGCSTDAFSVRPATYALTTSVAAPTKAGAQFTITAAARNASNAAMTLGTTTTGAPLLDNTKAPVAGGNQTLLQQSWNTGASFGTFIYNDVGTFSLPVNAIYDPQFGNAASEAQDRTNGDCNPGAGTTYVPNVCYGYTGTTCNAPVTVGPADSSGKYGCDIGSQALSGVGRFYPDHYEASLGLTQGCSVDGFTYMGQPFSMTSAAAGPMQIKALAAGQTFATAAGLPSYTGSYTPLASVWFGAQNGVASTTDLIKCISSTQNATANRCQATTLPTKPPPAVSTAWSLGSFTVTPTTYYFDPPKDATTTPDASWGAFDSLSVGVTVSDADGSTLTIPAGQSFVLNSTTYQSVNGSLPMKMRYGRMRLQNASGSEQVPAVVPVLLEYWSGSAWIPNVLDTTCTRLLGPPPTAYGGNTAAAACYGGAPASGAQCTSTTAGGVGSIYTRQLSAGNVPANAGVPTYSSAQFSYGQRNMILAAPKASGTLGVSILAPAWLKIGPTNPTGANPSATVRYSSYNSRFIFLRENY